MGVTPSLSEVIRIGNADALDAQGGVDLLLQVAAMVKVECPNVCWVLAGDGSLRVPLERLCSWLSIEDVVRFSGSGMALSDVDFAVSACRNAAGLLQQMQHYNVLGIPLLMMRLPKEDKDDAMRLLRWHPNNQCSARSDPESLAMTVVAMVHYCQQLGHGESCVKSLRIAAIEMFGYGDD